MNLNDVNKYREEKEYQARHGHLSKQDRDEMAYHRNYQDKSAKDYHSPDGEMHGVDYNSHGVELQ